MPTCAESTARKPPHLLQCRNRLPWLSYFLAQNYHLLRWPVRRKQKITAGDGRRRVVYKLRRASRSRSGFICLFRQCVAHADQIIGDDAETDPALHAALAAIAAAAETMPALDYADASLTSRPPFLPVAEPALLLLAPARRTLGGAIGYAHPFDTFGLSRSFVLGRVEARIRGYEARRAPHDGFVCLDSGDEQVRVGGTLIIDL